MPASDSMRFNRREIDGVAYVRVSDVDRWLEVCMLNLLSLEIVEGTPPETLEALLGRWREQYS